MPAVQPNVLTWARETAGLSLEAAAGKLGIHAARGASPIERLEAFELGQRQPSRPLLLRMAKAYRRSLLTLYLAAPPPTGDRGQDFRTLPQREAAAQPLVDALVRDIRTRQSLVRSVIEEDQDPRQLNFIGSARLSDGIERVSRSIRQVLEFDLPTFREQSTVGAAFTYLRRRAEGAGIFVLLIGNLGNYRTNIEVSSFRGFALADALAPFVVINDNDAQSAWSFTLLHELVHLWLGATGISGPYGDSQIERFCNDAASSILLSDNELRELATDAIGDAATLAQQITGFVQARRISRSMVAYRLFRLGWISEALWNSVATTFRQEWLAARQAQREHNQERENGPDYYVVRRHRLGAGLLRFVEQSMGDGLLTPTKASTVLGVKPRSVAPLLGMGGR